MAEPGLAEREEIRLLGHIAKGDKQAFDVFYRRYHPRLARFLERVTRRPGLVEELLNDTLLVVWDRAASFNRRSKVSTWVFAIAYRKALKALLRWDQALPAEALEQSVDQGPGPEQLLGQQQLHAALQEALDGLSAEHRAVVDLTYFHGLAYGEIAAIVDCPPDTVKTRMFYARRRLRVLLGGRLGDWL